MAGAASLAPRRKNIDSKLQSQFMEDSK